MEPRKRAVGQALAADGDFPRTLQEEDCVAVLREEGHHVARERLVHLCPPLSCPGRMYRAPGRAALTWVRRLTPASQGRGGGLALPQQLGGGVIRPMPPGAHALQLGILLARQRHRPVLGAHVNRATGA